MIDPVCRRRSLPAASALVAAAALLAAAIVVFLAAGAAVPGCAAAENEMPGHQDLRAACADFLDAYNVSFQRIRYEAKLAEWESETHIVPGDETNALRRRATAETLAAFTGGIETIEAARRFLAQRDLLSPLQVRQLEAVLFNAGDSPQSVPEIVRERIAREAAASEKLYGHTFLLDGREITPNEIDERLRSATDLAERRKVWECSKEVGAVLREDLLNLVRLRNAAVRALGYPDFFAYQASAYGAGAAEMLARNDRILREIYPLYRELHTWMRHELARRFGQPVPDLLPAHWLPNRWGQEWGAAVTVEGLDLDAALADKSPEWLVRQAERFYVSLGFAALPESFYALSSLYPLPRGAGYKKNTHASAWHLDLDQDVRSLMSVESNSYWYETVHHELGHVYYYLSYSHPGVPPVLREGADRSFHEAIGSLMGLAAMQPRFAAAVGLVPEHAQPDPIQALLKEALNIVVFMPWASGVMTRFEFELYAEELPAGSWNRRWWDLKAAYQGIVPPAERDERHCDPATKTHIIDDAAQYYDYALSYVLLFQLHDHVARTILREDPHDANYYGRRDAGAFLQSILQPGATRSGRELLIEATGEELSGRAMLRYFQPLAEWLEKQNKGRKHTLPPPP